MFQYRDPCGSMHISDVTQPILITNTSKYMKMNRPQTSAVQNLSQTLLNTLIIALINGHTEFYPMAICQKHYSKACKDSKWLSGAIDCTWVSCITLSFYVLDVGHWLFLKLYPLFLCVHCKCNCARQVNLCQLLYYAKN